MQSIPLVPADHEQASYNFKKKVGITGACVNFRKVALNARQESNFPPEM
jgi:hypothetical protein